jgi:hypothetical protein
MSDNGPEVGMLPALVLFVESDRLCITWSVPPREGRCVASLEKRSLFEGIAREGQIFFCGLDFFLHPMANAVHAFFKTPI